MVGTGVGGKHGRMNATLHVEHDITDFGTWKSAFDRFADVRIKAGVTGHRGRVEEHDPHHVVIDLDFGSTEPAHEFAAFLRDTVWATSANSPALVGAPVTRVLVDGGE